MSRPLTPEDIQNTAFPVVLRGYSQDEVDDFLYTVEQNLRAGSPPVNGPAPAFSLALHGYDRAQVDAFIAQLMTVQTAADPTGAGDASASAVVEPKRGFFRRLLG